MAALMVQPNDHDHFVLRQRVKLVINQYEFSTAGPTESDSDDEAFCFVEQKRFKFKEDIRFFTGPQKEEELLKILARQRFDPRAKYDISSGGEVVGQIQKVFGKSLIRSTFTLFDAADNEVATVRERSLAVALFRRLVGLVPYIGDFADWLPIPYDFQFLRGEEQVGIIRRRRWKWRDVYDIDMSADPGKTVDRRLVLATAVGTDALMAR